MSCQSEGVTQGGVVWHMNSWDKLVLWMFNPTEDTSNPSESSLSTKTQIRSALVFLLPQVDYEEQILFIEVGFDLDEDTGALVRVLVDEVQAAQGQGTHALEKIVFQILESPKNSEAHVTCLFELVCVCVCVHGCSYIYVDIRLPLHLTGVSASIFLLQDV